MNTRGSYNALGGGDPAWALACHHRQSRERLQHQPHQHRRRLELGRPHRAVHQYADQFLHCRQTTATPSSATTRRAANLLRCSTRGAPILQRPGWAPSTYNGNPVYGLFTANAAFISQNFTTQSLGTGAINGNDVDEPVNALTGSATGNGGYARTGTINLTRPAQGTATGVDLWLASYAGDGDDPTTIGFRARRNGRW